ncbi:phosphoglucosamine mutase [Natranaerofaba carboxydovora]|uniref:phosphoglucosamine mutase n=1 Tax=Natranaerofaba carboxydovora TaxID=2742683 RepID=UPI001F12A727|nr:phosphoglucosamine mutase [Natranaerofaba carboxydovora]UMZ75435.1 Phosphoglucosamine mutase [Natranaerofaba carboxydovora]
MTELFGTDGVRGVANSDLTPELCFKIGRAGAWFLRKNYNIDKILIGRDTRVSGPMLEGAIVAGITSVGVDVIRLGVVTTPAVALLTREEEDACGVMISASHNPVPDNGIKFFNNEGIKLTEQEEKEIESLVKADEDTLPRPTGEEVGNVSYLEEAGWKYINHVLERLKPLDLSGLKIVLDCGYGASYEIAPLIFEKLGAMVIAINSEPNGEKINVDCGSTHPDKAGDIVIDHNADVGFSFDGDGDRVIALDKQGKVLDGDKILAVLAMYLNSKKELPESTFVATVMSNLGLELAMEKEGINVEKTKVGDRSVLYHMKKNGYILGGEQSGHIINLRENVTGDGVITALNLMKAVKDQGKELGELASVVKPLPQVLVNVNVDDKEGLWTDSEIDEQKRKAEKELGDTGRVLIRPSGTEPKIRVMVEGQDEEFLHKIANELVGVIKKKLNKK